LLFEDETVLWRFALPRKGWWIKKVRKRIPDLKSTKNQIKKEEKEKRESWKKQRSWSVISKGVLLYVIACVHYLSSKMVFKIIPNLNVREFLQFLYQVEATFKEEKKKIVMVLDRSGIHKGKLVEKWLNKRKGAFEFYWLPPHSGHQLNPIEGFWRCTKDAVNANRTYEALYPLYRHTYTVLTKHREQPIYHFPWDIQSV